MIQPAAALPENAQRALSPFRQKAAPSSAFTETELAESETWTSRDIRDPTTQNPRPAIDRPADMGAARRAMPWAMPFISANLRDRFYRSWTYAW